MKQDDNSEDGPKLSAVVIFSNFGMYHFARLDALGQLCRSRGIEFASSQTLYGWKVTKDKTQLDTLYDGALEEMSSADVARSCVNLVRILSHLRPASVFIPGYSDIRCIAAAIWARINGAHAILMYETTEEDKPRNRAFDLLKTMLIRTLFSHAFAGGHRTALYLRKLRFPLSRTVTKYDVVDNAFFSQGCARCKDPSSIEEWDLPANYFLVVARLSKEKNHLKMITAYCRYRDAGGDWELVFVGRGPQDSELKLLVSRLGLEKAIHFVGFKNCEQILPYYAFARCFVLASTREPWGLVVNEAMASGLPVLVSEACGCVPDLVMSGSNGFTFDPHQAGDLASLLLLMSRLSENVRKAMGDMSRQIIANYAPADWAASAVRLMSSDRGNKRTTVAPSGECRRLT